MGSAHFKYVDVLLIMELMSRQGIPAPFRWINRPPGPSGWSKQFARIEPHVAASVIGGAKEGVQGQKLQLRGALRRALGARFSAAFGDNAASLIIQAVQPGRTV